MSLSPFTRTQYTLGPLVVSINWLVFACVIITAAGFIRLGLWQMDRAAEKVEAQRELEAELAVSAAPIESIPASQLRASNEDLQNRFVTLEGEYLNDRTILVVAEFFEGQIGYGVVTPLRLASTGQLVLVHRGWTTGILPPGAEPDLRTVSGPVRAGAQIHVPDPERRVIASEINANEWPLRIRTLEIDVISQILDEPLFPFEVRLIADQPGTLVRHWPAVNANVNQNLFYALQWFTFAFIVLLASLLASSNLWVLLKGSGEKP